MDSEAAAAAHLDEAITALEARGRYWFDDMRPVRQTLQRMLEERGYEIIMRHMPPDWEYVICDKKKYDHEQVEWLAQDRATSRARGIPEGRRLK